MHPRDRDLPQMNLKQEELPEVKHWDVNSKHYIILKVEVVAKRNTKAHGINDLSDKQKMEATLQVLNIKPLGDEPVDAKTLEQRDFEEVAARARTGKG